MIIGKVIKFKCIVFFFAAFPLLAEAQNEGAYEELDKKYTPPVNSLLGSGKNQGKGKSYDDSDISHSVKFNPIILSRSIVAFFYEGTLSDDITVQGGLGLSYKKDIIQTYTAVGEFDILDNSSSSLDLNTIMINATLDDGPNIFMSAAFKFYFSSFYYDSYAFDGGYFELGTRYNVNNVVLAKNALENSGISIAKNESISVKNLLFYAAYGHQFYTSGAIKTTHDFSFGFGLKKIKYDEFEEEEFVSPYTWETYYIHSKTGKITSFLVPGLFVGYAFGFGF